VSIAETGIATEIDDVAESTCRGSGLIVSDVFTFGGGIELDVKRVTGALIEAVGTTSGVGIGEIIGSRIVDKTASSFTSKIGATEATGTITEGVVKGLETTGA
jgi:hypothetical protein